MQRGNTLEQLPGGKGSQREAIERARDTLNGIILANFLSLPFLIKR